jgi:fatty acid desaturase
VHAFPTRRQLQDLVPGASLAEPRVLAFYAAFDWLVIATCWWVMALLSDSFVIYALGVLLIGGRLHALGVVLHDACHRPSRRKTPLLFVVEGLAGWPIGTTIDAMRYHHLRHHRASCMRSDPYRHPLALKGRWMGELLAVRGALLPLVWSLRAVCAPLALVLPGFRTPYARIFLQDRSGKDLRNDREVVRCARADLPQLAAHISAAFLVVRWQLPLVGYYLIPWMIAGVINARRVIREHEPHEVDDRAPATVWASTRTHTAWLGKLFLYPHNIGFHQAHHLYPAIAFGQLPAVHARLLEQQR